MLRNKFIIHSPEFRFLIFTFCILSLAFACFAQEQFKYEDKGKRNPFIPLVTQDGRILNLDKEHEAKKDLLIEGIIYDKQGASYAIVNGTVVGVGDFVGEFQVLKIEENKVIFIKEGIAKEVDFKKEE